jgi:hypothetical protein
MGKFANRVWNRRIKSGPLLSGSWDGGYSLLIDPISWLRTDWLDGCEMRQAS